MKKVIALLLITAMMLSLCACSGKAASKAEAYTLASEEKLKMYSDAETVVREMTIAKFSEYDNVAYVKAQEFLDGYLDLAGAALHSEGMELTYQSEGSIFTATRENGAAMTVNAAADTICFTSFEAFVTSAGARESEMLFDYGDYLKNEDDKDVYLVAKSDVCYAVQTQESVEMDLVPYHIDIIQYKNEIYLPFQLVSNLILSVPYQTYVCFDDCLCLTPELVGSEEYEAFYNSKSVKVTDALLSYNYYETCFFLDKHFALNKEEYNTSFDNLFIANGLKEKALQSVRGYSELLSFTLTRIIDDGHTNLYSAGPLDTDFEPLPYGQSCQAAVKSKSYMTARKNIMGTDIAPYTEIGNTAYITCDGFSEPTFDEYDTIDLNVAPADNSNTIYLFAYAYHQITRANSPIENVVVDISCNRGGDTRSLAFALGCIMDEVVFCTRLSVDNSIGFSGYKADCNLDHVIDEKDNLLSDKNIFVIESNCSYSCANVFACIAGQAGCIMLGEESGGGAGSVLFGLSSLGSVYQISGHFTMLIYKNGNYNTNDMGWPADYNLTKQQMYNRKTLTEYINGLVK